MMAPRFSISLIVLMLLITVFAATSKAEAPVCQIPEGHYDGEVVAYYHPEPRSGAVCTVEDHTQRIIRTCLPRFCCREPCNCDQTDRLHESFYPDRRCLNKKLICYLEHKVVYNKKKVCCDGSIMLNNTRRCQMIDQCIENTPGCKCVENGSGPTRCICAPGYEFNPDTFLCTKLTPPSGANTATSESTTASATPPIPAQSQSNENFFQYPYIAAAALLLLLLLLLLLFLLCRRCRRRREPPPTKFDAEKFVIALYDKQGLPLPPAYVVDVDEEKKEKIKKEKMVEVDDIDDEKRKKKPKSGKTSEKKMKKKYKDELGDLGDKKAIETGEKTLTKNNLYSEMPSVKMSRGKAEMAGIVMEEGANSLPKNSASRPPLPPPFTIYSSGRGRPLTVSDNTGDYAEILDTEPSHTAV